MTTAHIRSAEISDCETITRIYNHYIRETIITFEETEVDSAEIAARLTDVQKLELPWLVVEHPGGIAGYAYATRWRTRAAYRFAVETTIYLDPEHIQRGLGRPLYEALIARLRDCGIHTAIGGIALPNPASIALHERLGFVNVARFMEVGFKFGQWIDVGYWQLSLVDN